MKHRTHSIFGLGISVAVLVYLLGYKTHEVSFSVSDLLNEWDRKTLSLFNKKTPIDVFSYLESNTPSIDFSKADYCDEKKIKPFDSCVANVFSCIEFEEPTQTDFCEPNCCDEKRIKTFNPCIDVTASARGCVETTGPYLEAAYLFWHSSIEDLSVTSNIQPISINQTKEKIKQLNYKYESGFKLGLGYNLSYDYWDVLINWTRLHSQPESSWSSTTQSLHASLLAPFEGAGILGSNSVHSRWKLHFDTVDLELGRRLFLGRNLAVRPYAGLKGAWVTSKLNTSYAGINSLVFDAANVSLKDRNQGIGLRFGMQGRWDLGCSNFAILANIAGAVLWNNIKVQNVTNEFRLDGTLGGGVKEAHYHALKPLMECFIGLDWGSCFCKKYYLGISAGYEMQFWWDYNTFFITSRNTTAYDLRLHGLTATITIDF
ncbi:MAG: Lpg1974 family pore-forming outer membrane protein [Candidatus Rhabdochlamydia sp.]